MMTMCVDSFVDGFAWRRIGRARAPRPGAPVSGTQIPYPPRGGGSTDLRQDANAVVRRPPAPVSQGKHRARCA
jgi:hypothetical protein